MIQKSLMQFSALKFMKVAIWQRWYQSKFKCNKYFLPTYKCTLHMCKYILYTHKHVLYAYKYILYAYNMSIFDTFISIFYTSISIFYSHISIFHTCWYYYRIVTCSVSVKTFVSCLFVLWKFLLLIVRTVPLPILIW